MQKTIRGIDHIGVVVPDLDEATRFLEAAFGAQVIYQSISRSDPPLEGKEIEGHTSLVPGTRITGLRMIRMERGPDIELFEMRGPVMHPPAQSSDFGMTHMAFYADDPEAAVDRFERAGGVMFMRPTEIPVALETGEGNFFCYGRTPWGMLIEFISYPSHMAYEDAATLRRWHHDAGSGREKYDAGGANSPRARQGARAADAAALRGLGRAWPSGGGAAAGLAADPPRLAQGRAPAGGGGIPRGRLRPARHG